jgi:hypothetical protein
VYILDSSLSHVERKVGGEREYINKNVGHQK